METLYFVFSKLIILYKPIPACEAQLRVTIELPAQSSKAVFFAKFRHFINGYTQRVFAEEQHNFSITILNNKMTSTFEVEPRLSRAQRLEQITTTTLSVLAYIRSVHSVISGVWCVDVAMHECPLTYCRCAQSKERACISWWWWWWWWWRWDTYGWCGRVTASLTKMFIVCCLKR